MKGAFGSLSVDAPARAMKAHGCLLIGVIPHASELKERIGKQIVVQKRQERREPREDHRLSFLQGVRMTYDNIRPAVFQSRPNRFIAHCAVDGKTEICHVKNTGRCKELLLPGASVYLQKAVNPHRSTGYDLIAVKKGERLVNMDSQIPNRVFRQWAEHGGIPGVQTVRPECAYGDSRFDFYVETDARRLFVEVKGVTLEADGVAMFPDAPTERGVKHVRELCRCVREGYGAMIVFIIQMEGVRWFTPNDRTHPAFGDALREAQKCGVEILALDTIVTPDSITANRPVHIRL